MESTIFIAAVIAGATEAVKNLFPQQVYGIVTIMVALLVGAGVGAVDTSIGLMDITIAQGIMFALGTIGTVTVANKVG